MSFATLAWVYSIFELAHIATRWSAQVFKG